MALDAVIFDVDGTLVDTNDLHVQAWVRAFAAHGYQINADRITTEVGKGGDQLVPAVLGHQADQKDGDALRAAEPMEFKKLAEAQGINVFSHALDLLDELRARGIKVLLATSSSKKQLATVEQFAGIQFAEHVDDIVTADDAKKSKPHPDLIRAAVQKLKLSPAQCAMIGDTIWDAHACRGAGVVCVGVLSGGNPAEKLYEAGARVVRADVAAIHKELNETLEVCSPGPTHLTTELLEQLMREALSVADEAIAEGEAPIGCVLARGDGRIIARGHNEQNRSQNKAAHAEIVAFAHAAGKAPLDARDLILVSTLEPCVMCTGAAMEAAVDTIVFALRAPADAGSHRVTPPRSDESQIPRIVGDVLAKQSRKLFEKFLATDPRADQRAFVEALLRDQ